MMRLIKRLFKLFLKAVQDDNFLKMIHWSENFISKVLSVALLIVVFVSTVDLIIFLAN